MKTYEFYAEKGQDWIEKNIAGLCGNCEMIPAHEYEEGTSDAYIVDGYILHVCYSSVDIIESHNEDGEVIEYWFLDNE